MLPTPLERAPRALCDFAGRDELWLKREDVHELGAFKWRSTLPVVTELVDRGTSRSRHVVDRESRRRRGVGLPPSRHERDRVRASLGERAEARACSRVWEPTSTPQDTISTRPRMWRARTRPSEGSASSRTEPSLFSTTPTARSGTRSSSSARPCREPWSRRSATARSQAASERRSAGERPAPLRVGVVASEMPVMAASYDAGEVVDVPAGATIADGLAVRVAIPLAVERLSTAVDLDAARLGALDREGPRRMPRRGCPRRALCSRGPRGDSRDVPTSPSMGRSCSS